MGRPSLGGEVGPGLSDDVQLRQTQQVVDSLLEGQEVATEDRIQACGTLARQLWGEGPAANRPQEAMVVVYATSTDAVRGAVLAEVVAAGDRASVAFDLLTSQSGDSLLTPAEITELRQSLAATAKERLTKVANLLRTAVPDFEDDNQNDASGSGSREAPETPPPPQPVRPAVLPRRVQQEEGKGDSSSTPGDGGRSDDLDDPAIPEEDRLSVVSDLGASAVPKLVPLLAGKQREFASTALIHLAENPEARRPVVEAMQRLTLDPDLRPIAEYILRSVNDPTTEYGTGDAGSRFGAEDAGIADDWLNRAIRSADTHEILRAAAGREASAISMIMQQHIARRERREA